MRVFIFACLLFLLSHCGDNNDIEQIPDLETADLVGDWTISRVLLDGERQKDWEGLKMIFKQDEKGAVSYEVARTPNAVVWKEEGNATIIRNGILALDTDVYVAYYVKADDLKLSMTVNGTGQEVKCPTDGDVHCPLVVTGVWTFQCAKN